MSDIVERLRRDSMWEEAEHIEHLRRDRDDYKQLYADALRDYVEKRNEVERLRGIIENVTSSWFDTSLGEEHMDGVMDEARSALEGKDV